MLLEANTTQRYVLPLISPPTPPQLEADKASIDASFTRAFTLIDQLTADTATLKSSEAGRTEKLDNTLKEVDTVIGDLKAANTRRESESRIIADQVQGLKDLVPKALEGWKAGGDAKLEELGQELQSLKRLLENRVGRSAGTPTPAGRGHPSPAVNGNEKAKDSALTLSSSTNEVSRSQTPEGSSNSTAPASGVTVPKRDSSASSARTERSDRRAAIPAWQMAAGGKSGASASSTGGEGNTVDASA